MRSSHTEASSELKKKLLTMQIDENEVALQEIHDAGNKIRMQISGNAVPGLMVLALMWSSAPKSLLLILLGFLSVNIGLKLLLQKHYPNVTTETLFRYRAGFILLSAFTGAIWGVGTVYMYIYLPPEYHEIIGFITGALTAGALATSGVLRWTYFAFVAPIFLPQIAYQLSHQNGQSLYLALMLTIFFFFLVTASEAYRKLFLEKNMMTALAVQSLEKLRYSEQRLKEITTSMGEGVFVINENEELTFINPEGERLLGWSFSELTTEKTNLRRTLQDSQSKKESVVMRALKEGTKTHSDDEQFRRKDGNLISVSLTVAPLETENGEKHGSVAVFEDITTAKKLQEQLAEMALHDPLTGLYNRRYFNDKLTDELSRSTRYGRPLTLLILDIDHFKKVNDTYGHLAGDDVLHAIAQRLSMTIRKIDYAARYGGDELAVILPETTRKEAVRLAERIRKAVVGEMFTLPEDGSIGCTVSIGVGSLVKEMTAEQLIQEADTCLYQAKNSGRNRVV